MKKRTGQRRTGRSRLFKENEFFRTFKAPKIISRLRKDEDGATAIEFAILGIPFFALLMAIIESSLLFFAGQVLESSVDDVARRIRTGQLDQTMTAATLKTEICNEASLLFDCADINVDMQVVATFNQLGSLPQVNGVVDPGKFGFQRSGPRQIVMLTVMSEWPVFTNYLQKYLSDLDNGNALLTAVAAFMTEPF